MSLRSLLVGSVAIAAIAGLSPALPTAINPVSQVQAAVNASVSLAVFYDKLAPYGQWVSFHDNYVFVPDNLPDGWRPYTVGHWEAARQYGWIWASDEPFGWATYHYGRWGYDEEIGWYWVPGTMWGPAWVTWRSTAEDVVWAPLPPGGQEESVVVDVSVIPEDYWVVVPTAQFLEPNLAVVIIVDRNEHGRIFADARPLGSVKIVNRIVVNNVIKVKDIEAKTNTKVKLVNVTKSNDPSKIGASGKNITAFTGKIEARKDEKPSKIADVGSLKKGQAKPKMEQGQQAPQQNQPGVTTGEQQTPQGQTPGGMKKKKPGVTTGEQQTPEGQAPSGGMKKKKSGYANNPPSGNQPNAAGQQNQQQQAETPDQKNKKKRPPLSGNESGTNALKAPNQNNGGEQGQAPKANRPPVIENQNQNQEQMNQGNEPQGQKKGLQCNPQANPNCPASP